VIGADNVGDSNRSIQRWTGGGWHRVAGAALRVAVGPGGQPWVVNAQGTAGATAPFICCRVWPRTSGSAPTVRPGSSASTCWTTS
jgi:hypothetical protein